MMHGSTKLKFVDVCDKSTRSKDLALNSCLHETITRTQTLREEIELLCNERFSQITDVTPIDLLSCTLFVSCQVCCCLEYPYCGNLVF